MNKQQIREWMMARLDGESTPEQDAQIDLWTAADPGLRKEYEQMMHLKELAQTNRPVDLPPEKWDQYWLGVYPKLERRLAWILMSLGAVVLIGAASWEAGKEWILSPDIPLWIKLAGGSFWLGCTIMLVSVTREKLFLHKHERYKDIQR